MPNKRKIAAYTLPMLVFVALFVLNNLLRKINPPSLSFGAAGNRFWLSSPEYWMYPLQTLLCGGVVWWFHREYQWARLARPIFVIAIAVAVFLIWISPQAFFGFSMRTAGFDPEVFSGQPALYGLTIALRFLRLVVVAPLIEEIFWRGFFLRYLIAEDFDRVPFGKFSWLSFTAVTVLFAFSHSKADWAAALFAGALYSLVAYRTRSLSSCIFAHGLTNLLLGFWIMNTRQWGFW
jgi:CAAX protease family protein